VTGFLTILHIIVSLLLIIIVLLQSGKSADLAGAFGGAGSQSTFGPRGAASFLSQMTTTLAVLFMVSSLLLYITAANNASAPGVMKGKDAPVQEQKIDEKKETATENKEKSADSSKQVESKDTKTEKNTKTTPAKKQPKPDPK